jgi:hypothetical protein
MGGTLTASDTVDPGDRSAAGLTMTVELPAVAAPAVPELQRAEP